MPGQEPESLRRAASPSAVPRPEDKNFRLREMVASLEEKVTQELASAFGGGGVANMRREMEQMSIQIGGRELPFDIEQYFLAVNVEDETRKVSTATMYFSGDAKLWWRTKYSEIQANQVRLDTWALLREAICEQFFPENVEYNARRALRKLEHSDSVRDYVKAFTALMLDIRDMSEKDKLFTFMEGMKPWARLELQR
ncbi:UNVERIFIED_CONTAM: hypothetical protein Slati_1494700 [Sesamum latifolium]|uniref:Retrotransposon gag domain-containing protein n=1 Tax=Sesamum latifolium TaxID=2727402 RepID=A0AAW2X685_9LAMI